MPGKNFIFISLIVFSISLPFLTGAITPGTVPSAGELGIPESPIEEPEELLDVVAGVVTWTYVIFFIIAVMYVLFAAYNYLTGADEPETIKKARRQLIYAAIAIIVALLAYGIVAIVENFLKQPTETGGSNVQIQAPAGTTPSGFPTPGQSPPGAPY